MGCIRVYEDNGSVASQRNQMLTDLEGSNNTIILDQTVAKQLGLNLYDEVGIDFTSCARKLRVVGFFGPAPQETNRPIPVYSSGYDSWISSPFYSYVPRNLFNMTAGSDIYSLESFRAMILFSLNSGVNGTEVAEKIRDLNLEVYGVDSLMSNGKSRLEWIT